MITDRKIFILCCFFGMASGLTAGESARLRDAIARDRRGESLESIAERELARQLKPAEPAAPETAQDTAAAPENADNARSRLEIWREKRRAAADSARPMPEPGGKN